MKPRRFHFSKAKQSVLAIVLVASISHLHAQSNGTWSANAAGNWSDPGNWTDGAVASGAGATADFSTVDITADHVITINTPVTVGTLKTGDLTTLSNSWVFTGPGPLTLDNGASQPVLHIMNRTPTISAPLAGTNGLSKISAGAVTLAGDNSALSGTLSLENVTGTNSAGLILANNAALGGMTTININGTPTSGQYLGLGGGVTLGAGITLNLTSQGGNSGPEGAIRSQGGTAAVNIINGPININGGGVRIANNASKLLEINGPITGGSNPVTFRFASNDGIHVTNTANSWTGLTTHSQGNVWFDPGTLPASAPLMIAASGAGTVMTSGTFTRALGTGVGQVRLGGAETTVATRALGLSAKGGDLAVNFGAAAAELYFNNFTTNTTGTPTTINTNIFVLNGGLADSKITLANPLNLNGAGRTLQVSANVAELTGAVNGGAFALTKTGAGRLLLSAASTWLGDLTIAGGDGTSAGFVRITHPEALGAAATVKSVNTNGSNRGVSVLELDGGITIDANKTLKMAGKSFYATTTAAQGLQQSLRSVSGTNTWAGDCLIAVSGGSYGAECVAGTLTLGSGPGTTSVLRNDVTPTTANTRGFTLFGEGDFTIHLKITDNNLAKTALNKLGTGKLTLTSADSDFTTTPNLYAGLTGIDNLADGGVASALGSGTGFNLGGTLRYTGTGHSSNRSLGLFPVGGTLDSSGSGPLVLNGTGMTHQTGITGTTAAAFDAGATELLLNENGGITVGQSITGTNLAAGTTITAVNTATRAVTLSLPTTAASVSNFGVAVTIGGAHNFDRTLTLTGTNTGDNGLGANLTNPAGTGRLGITKTGLGKWLLTGTAHSYTGPTTVAEGTLGFDGSFPYNSLVTVAPAATLQLANLVLTADAVTGKALDIDGHLVLNGPVFVGLDQAAPVGTFAVIEAASITGVEKLVSNYRTSSFASGGTTASITVGAGLPLTWTGATSDAWDITTSGNWKDGGGVPQKFFWGDPVRFDDGGNLQPTVVLAGELRPASIKVESDITNYAFTGTGSLAGPCGLIKNGTASLTIGGTHTFSGGITLNGGLLIPQTNQALGGNGQKITIAAGAALDTNGTMNANRDYEVTIAGTGTDGAGAIVNSGASHNNGFRALTLAADATIGGVGRFDVRPITAGTAAVDLAGFTLTKAGTNTVSFVDGTLTSAGSINLNDGTLTFTRMTVGGTGSVNVGSVGVLAFENYTAGSFDKAINLNNGGTLRALGSNFTTAAAVTLATTGTFDVETGRTLTLTSPVTGTGDLVKSASTGGLALVEANTYTGTTLINAGTLVIGSQTTLGTLGAGAVTNHGTLVINRGDDAYVVSNPIDGTGALTIGQVTGGSFTSVVTVTGANTFSGNVTVNSGALKIFNAGALGSGTKTVTLTNGTNGRPQLQLDGSAGNITLPAEVSFTTSSANPDLPAIGNLAGDNVINGNFTLVTGGGSTAISVFGGSLTLNGNIAANTTLRRLILGGTASTGAVNGIISDGGNAVGLDKVGATVWTLTGNNSYTGTTVISGGTLLVNGNQGAASGTVTVNSGGTLGGIGTLGGTLSALGGSTVAPGMSIGTLTTLGPAALAGSFAVELDATSCDRLTVGGSLDIAGSTLNVSVSGVASQPAYVIASYGLLSGRFATTTGIPAGYGIDYDYQGLKQIALVAGTPYSNWESLNGIGGAGADADSDNDGVVNGIEFVIGGDPSGPASGSSQLLPTVTTDGTYLNFVFRRADASISYNPVVEYGTTLTGWTPAQAGVNGVVITTEDDAIGEGIDQVTVKIPRALAAPGTKLFGRLKVVIP